MMRKSFLAGTVSKARRTRHGPFLLRAAVAMCTIATAQGASAQDAVVPAASETVSAAQISAVNQISAENLPQGSLLACAVAGAPQADPFIKPTSEPPADAGSADTAAGPADDSTARPVPEASATLEQLPAACTAPPVRPAAPDIFGMAATPVSIRATHQDWDGARTGLLADARGPWDELLGEARRLAGDNPLDMVNRWVNWHVLYQDDRNGDAWSSAAETLQRGTGDCEDLAIVKMALLTELGIGPDDMFLVIVRQKARGADHAVLAVRRDGAMVVLDSSSNVLQPAGALGDAYQPTLSYSGSFAWIYGYRARNAGDTAAAAKSASALP